MEIALAKFIDSWLMPLPLALVLIGLGCLCLWWQKLRSGRFLVTAGWLFLVICSCSAMVDLMLVPLEDRYPKWDGRGAHLAFVVVMGAGQGDAPRLPETNRPNPAAVYRLLEGVAIYRANPGSKLILSGGSGDLEPSAELMARIARTIGIDAQDILTQSVSRNTEQEVRLLAPMVGQQRFAVVTSAAHMRRTMDLFAAAGLQPQPAPTHFLDLNPHPNWRDVGPPNAESLIAQQFALHEYFGLLWLKIKALWS